MSKKVIVLDSLFVIFIVCATWLPIILSPFVGNDDLLAAYFGKYLLPILLSILAFEAVMVVVTIVAMIAGIKNGKNYTEKTVYGHAKTQMIMRFVQVPFYVTVFHMAFLSFLGLMTIPLTIAFAIIDMVSITLSALCSVAVYYEMRKKGFITLTEQVIYSICGFIYCVDIPVALIAFIRAFAYRKNHGR